MTLEKMTLVKMSGPKVSLAPDGTVSGKIRLEYDILTKDYDDNVIDAVGYLPQELGAPIDSPGSPFVIKQNPFPLYVQTFRDADKKCNTTHNEENGSMFRGIIEYSRVIWERPEEEVPPTPDDPVTIDMSLTQRQEALSEDRFGKAVKNSAGDMYSKPIMVKTGECRWQISRHENWNPIHKILDYSPKYGCVNNNSIWGFSARTLWLLITAKFSSNSDWNVTYNIEYNSETWDYNALDEGFYYLDGGQKKQILDKTIDAKPKQVPTRLNGAGGIAADDEVHFNAYEKAIPMNFLLLALPDISMIR